MSVRDIEQPTDLHAEIQNERDRSEEALHEARVDLAYLIGWYSPSARDNIELAGLLAQLRSVVDGERVER